MQRGFLTIEIVLALALMTLAVAAVFFASAGTQDFIIGAHNSREARSHAETLLAGEQALAQQDFGLVNPVATTTSGIYKEWVSVTETENFAKDATGYVSWYDGREHHLSVSTRISDYPDAVGGNTCSSLLIGDWQHPAIANFSFNELIADASTTTYPITGIDAYNGRLYVTVSNTSVNTKTFFIFDISNPMSPHLLGAIDNDTADKTGLEAVAVAQSSAGSYAYAASASSFSKGQLQIFDVHDPLNPQLVKTFKIATSTVPAAGLGNSIFYKNGYAYLGLASAAGGTEFNIIDVHNPFSPARVGGYSFNSHAVNGILIKNNYAYILHPTDSGQRQQLTLLDISDPAHPATAGYFYTGDTNAHGKSIFALGNTLYVGMTVSSTTPELYFLDGSNAGALSQTPPLIQNEIGSSVVGLLVRDSLAFLLTTKQAATPGQLEIINATSAEPVLSIALPGTGASGVALDCEGNYIYSASNDASGNGSLTVVTGS